MEFEPEDQQVIELLSKIRNKGGTYPRKLLANRRQVFLQQMVNVGMGLGVGEGIKTIAKAPKSSGFIHLPALSMSSFMEIILMFAILTQATIIAYSYRNRIADIFHLGSPPIALTNVLIPVTGSSTSTPVVVSDTPTLQATDTLTPSPTITATIEPSIPGINSSSDANPSVTQAPPTQDNNGNHFGQTPKPERTKENGNPEPTKAKNDPKPTAVRGPDGNNP